MQGKSVSPLTLSGKPQFKQVVPHVPFGDAGRIHGTDEVAHALRYRDNDLHRADAVHLRDGEIRQRSGRALMGRFELGARQRAVVIRVGQREIGRKQARGAASGPASIPSELRSSILSKRLVAFSGLISRPEPEWA